MFSNANINPGSIAANVRRPIGQGRTRRRGKGFFGNLWRGIKKAAHWVKDNKIISRVAGVIPGPIAKMVGTAAGAVGLGRRRRGGARMYIPTVRMRKSVGGRRKRTSTVRRRRGGSMKKFLTGAHKFIKTNRLASKAARAVGWTNLAKGIHQAGYGRKPRVVRRRRAQGGSFKKFLTGAHKFVKDHRIASKALKTMGFTRAAKIAASVGYGRRRRTTRKRTTRRRN